MPQSTQTGDDRRLLDDRFRWKRTAKSSSAPRMSGASYDVVNQLLDEPPVSGSASAPQQPLLTPPTPVANAGQRESPRAARQWTRRKSTLLWLLISMTAGAFLALIVFRTLGMLPVSAAMLPTDRVVALKPRLAESRLFKKRHDVADVRLFRQLPPDLSLGSYVTQFARLIDTPISLDVDTLRFSRATLDTVISPRAIETEKPRGSTLAAFAATLQPYGLKCFAMKDQVVIRGMADNQRMRHAMHDVSDLLPESGVGLDLVPLITQLIEPDSWQVHGGRGSIALNGDVLSIRNTDLVHRDILVICETLRNDRGLPSVSQVDVPLSIKTVQDGMDRLRSIQVDVYSDQLRPLQHELALLEKSCGYTFLVDWHALEATTPLRFEDSLVAIGSDPTSLYERLRRIVSQLGLTFRIVGKRTIEITSMAEELRRDSILVHTLSGDFDPAQIAAELPAEITTALPWIGDRIFVDLRAKLMIARLPQSRQVILAEWLEN